MNPSIDRLLVMEITSLDFVEYFFTVYHSEPTEFVQRHICHPSNCLEFCVGLIRYFICFVELFPKSGYVFFTLFCTLHYR